MGGVGVIPAWFESFGKALARLTAVLFLTLVAVQLIRWFLG